MTFDDRSIGREWVGKYCLRRGNLGYLNHTGIGDRYGRVDRLGPVPAIARPLDLNYALWLGGSNCGNKGRKKTKNLREMCMHSFRLPVLGSTVMEGWQKICGLRFIEARS